MYREIWSLGFFKTKIMGVQLQNSSTVSQCLTHLRHARICIIHKQTNKSCCKNPGTLLVLPERALSSWPKIRLPGARGGSLSLVLNPRLDGIGSSLANCFLFSLFKKSFLQVGFQGAETNTLPHVSQMG